MTGSDVTGFTTQEEAQTNRKLRNESSGRGESSQETPRQGWGGDRGGVKFKYVGVSSERDGRQLRVPWAHPTLWS